MVWVSGYGLPQQTHNARSRIKERPYEDLALDLGLDRHMLQKHSHSNTPHFLLYHVSVDSAPKYTALSYCWRDDFDKQSLRFDDTAARSIVLSFRRQEHHSLREIESQLFPEGPESDKVVSRSLFNALLRMRADGHQYIWADQICINQADPLEKEHQVNLMKNIYMNASGVFAWLGEDTVDNEARRGFQLARTISTAVSNTTILTDQFNLLGSSRKTCLSYNIPMFRDVAEDYLALMDLLKRPYWRRSWIVQELTHNIATVHCGSSRITFKEFAQSIFCCQKIGTPFDPDDLVQHQAFSALVRASVAVHGGITLTHGGIPHTLTLCPSCQLKDILTQHRCCQASDSRDKIFAFLSLAKDVDPSNESKLMKLKARYRDYFGVEDLYRDVTLAILDYDKTLDVLGASGSKPSLENLSDSAVKSLEKFTSWTPNWSSWDIADSVSYTSKGLYGEPFGLFSTSLSSIADIQKTSNPNHLGISGFVFDTVIDISDDFTVDMYNSPSKMYKHLLHLERFCGLQNATCPRERFGLESFCRILTADGGNYAKLIEPLMLKLEPSYPKVTDSFTMQYLRYRMSQKSNGHLPFTRFLLSYVPVLLVLILWVRSLGYFLIALLNDEEVAAEVSDMFTTRLVVSTLGRRMAVRGRAILDWCHVIPQKGIMLVFSMGAEFL
ncbi:heterokaryon incompatibility protein-domain-containing protein [Phaeosphaeriaceae sp. PMI808]|nr:heterokaryon incompatibility protein-domain-containing protein [Phaeosphaeriaceae sp. PMI808]